ncbi:LysR family transcriptional regulator, partial [Pseudomonas aeruginosa]
MNQFQEMATYIAVVEAANISAAARRLGTTKSVVSRRIQQLETRLGTVLFERGKTLGLTDAGHLFYQRAVLILSEVSDAEESVRTLHGQLQGPLRLTAPMAFSIR